MADIDLPLVGDAAWGEPLNQAIQEINTDVETRALDSAVVHTTGDEAVSGLKSFGTGIQVPDGSLPISATAGLQAALDEAAEGGGGGVGIIDAANGRLAIDFNGTPFTGTRDEGVSEGALAGGGNSIAIGGGATKAGGNYSTVIGAEATALGYGSTAIGEGTESGGSQALSAGSGSSANGSFSVALGEGATSAGTSATAAGSTANAVGDETVAVGASASAVDWRDAAFGARAVASGSYATALGATTTATGNLATAVGSAATATGESSVSVAGQANGEEATAAGYKAKAGRGSTALGAGANAMPDSAVSIGGGATSVTRERATLAARDFEVARNSLLVSEDTAQELPTYGSSLETGIILTDDAGVRWRITVDASGNLQVVAPAVSLETVAGAPLASAGAANWTGVASSSDGTKLVAARSAGNIWTSVDSGTTWTERTASGSRSWAKVACSNDGATIIAITSGTGYIYRSTDSGATWAPATAAGSRAWIGVAISGDGLKTVGWTSATTWLYRSLDGGATWAQTGPYVASWTSAEYTPDSGVLYATNRADRFLHYSPDGGTTWMPSVAPEGLETPRYGLLVGLSAVFGYTSSSLSTLDYSSDQGVTWDGRGSPSGVILALCASDDLTKLTAFFSGLGIFRSIDSGSTWRYVNGSATTDVRGMSCSADGLKVFLSVYQGLHRIAFS